MYVRGVSEVSRVCVSFFCDVVCVCAVASLEPEQLLVKCDISEVRLRGVPL